MPNENGLNSRLKPNCEAFLPQYFYHIEANLPQIKNPSEECVKTTEGLKEKKLLTNDREVFFPV